MAYCRQLPGPPVTRDVSFDAGCNFNISGETMKHLSAYGVLAALLIAGWAAAGETEDNAVATIVRLGGKVRRDAKEPGHPVIEVDLFNTKVTDKELGVLYAFRQLQDLNLRATRVTDAGLKSVAALRGLKTLNLHGTHVTDAGLKALAGCTQLRTLVLSGSRITDAGMKELARLSQLESLALRATRVTEAGVVDLKRSLPNCQVVR
jgi:hypothetical protein